jgi:hypothetical protein
MAYTVWFGQQLFKIGKSVCFNRMNYFMESPEGEGGGDKAICLCHMISRGIRGHAPPGDFSILDSLRLLLKGRSLP